MLYWTGGPPRVWLLAPAGEQDGKHALELIESFRSQCQWQYLAALRPHKRSRLGISALLKPNTY